MAQAQMAMFSQPMQNQAFMHPSGAPVVPMSSIAKKISEEENFKRLDKVNSNLS